ncbi:hypothetical protein D3C86_829090 [compost metagenome]|jgi:hypothetical protein
MATKDDIAWFKANFFEPMAAAIKGTPLTVDFLTALACQESGEIWPIARKKITAVDKVMALCVGDTLDGRGAFPKTRQELLDAPNGQAMFDLGRKALEEMAAVVGGAYKEMVKKPHKYCHGYGVYQVDIQHFLKEPDYFLSRQWASFDGSLKRAMGVLKFALKKRGFQDAASLSDFDLATVGIVYNTGGYKESRGLEQGFQPEGGKHYGPALFDLIRLAHTVPNPGAAPLLATPPAGEALIAAPSSVTTDGVAMKVAITEGMLRVRSEPLISDPPQANVLAHLPDGHPVRAVAGPTKGFFEIETSLNGALIHGFASRKFLIDGAPGQRIDVVRPASASPASGIVAVDMPEKAGLVTRRKDRATARSLNEKGAPGRSGTTPDELRAQLGAIVAYLDVENPDFLRYQPTRSSTFCNIYAHDFCRLAGVYVPRVWWTSPALLQLKAGKQVPPLLGNTIAEMRANDLFRWLQDFGPTFGWRQTGTLTKLQTEANQGAVGIIVARRREDGKSGHIVMVVPETTDDTAKRDGSGDVTAPLQSQAGARNFRLGRGKPNWWKGEEFAESAFWLHA